jgi:nicotinamidase-related amidase
MTAGIGPVARTTPYPWPWDGGCSGDRLALVVVGWDIGWRSRVAPSVAAAAEDAVGELVTRVAAAGGLVVAVLHPRPPRSADVDANAGVPSAAEVTALGAPVTASGGPAPDPGLWISRQGEISRAQNGSVRQVTSAGVDGFHGSGLDAALRVAGVTHLLVAGHGLEGPVHSTLRSANDRGYECLLVVDACSPLVPDLAGAARSMVEMSGGIFGAVGTTADVLAALIVEPARLTT